jgi:hypothetical protein
MSTESVTLAKKMLKLLNNPELAVAVIDEARKVAGYYSTIALSKALREYDGAKP